MKRLLKNNWLIRTAVLVLVGVLVASMPLLADEFHLVTGGRLIGDMLNPDQSPRTHYEIQTAHGRLVLDKKQVERVVVKPVALKQYEQAVPKVKNTVAGHWEMAQKCSRAELWPQRDFHLAQVLKLDPNHEEARRLLGYTQIDNRWQRTDVWLRQQGYVRYKKRWRLPQEIAADMAAEKRLQEEVQLKVQINRWRTTIVKGRSGSDQAMRELEAIDNPLAAPILARLLGQKNEPRMLKLIYVDLLSKLSGPVAVDALVDRVMQDRDEQVREVCLEQLRKWKSRRAIVAFVIQLRSSNNMEINQAGYALGQIGHADAIVPLIDALTSKHKIQIGNPNQINAGFSPTGSGGLGVGGRPKIIEREVQNKRVHGGLLLLVPDGINYRFDKAGWKNWYAQTNTPQEVNLRRTD